MKPLIYYSTLVIILLSSCEEKKMYDETKISSETEINIDFSNRGVRSKNNTIYFVEKDNKTLTAYQNNKIAWQTNIIKVCGVPFIGPPEVRYLKLKGKDIFIIFGKHSFANVDITNGETTCLGAD